MLLKNLCPCKSLNAIHLPALTVPCDDCRAPSDGHDCLVLCWQLPLDFTAVLNL